MVCNKNEFTIMQLFVLGHRFDDAKGMRRHKVKDIRGKNGTSIFSSLKGDGEGIFPFGKKTYDHNPHEVLVIRFF